MLFNFDTLETKDLYRNYNILTILVSSVNKILEKVINYETKSPI